MEEFIVPPTEGMRIVREIGPFDKGLATLAQQDVQLWNAEELAGLRVLLGASHPVSVNGSWVSNGFVYMNDTDADVLVVSGVHNSLLKNPAPTTQAHRDGKEVYVPDAALLRDRASSDVARARESGVFLLERNQVKTGIQPEAFGDEALSQYLLGTNAVAYGRFLAEQRIKEVLFYVADADYARKQEHPFARALWVGGLDDGSGLLGYYIDLHDDSGRVGGVRSYAREAGAPQVPVETRVAPVESELERELGRLTPGQVIERNGRVYACLDPASLKR